MKDKYGYPIPDRFNRIRKSSENKSGTWRDDEYEHCMLDVIELIEKKYPKDLRKQKSMYITLPTAFAMYIVEKEIKKHEEGKTPHYMRAGEHLLNMYEAMDVPKHALLNQMAELMEYLEDYPQIREDEIIERMR